MKYFANKVEYLHLNVNNLEVILKLIKLYENVFKMEPLKYPYHSYLENMIKNDNIIFVVAKYNNEIIGGLTAHILASTILNPMKSMYTT